MAEEDNFDIDIYGDGDGEVYGDEETQEPLESVAPEESSDAGASQAQAPPSHLPPKPQGVKRERPEEQPTDPGATAAVFVSDLPWWITDDEIRGWANECSCEEELEEITFSEHKVNGKSKGQAYILMSTPQAANSIKHQIDSFADGQRYKQRFTASYTNPFSNPFKTLPKDSNNRNSNQSGRNPSGGYNSGSNSGSSGPGSGFNPPFRGGRGGGYNSRGAAPNVGGGYGRGGMGGGYQGGGNMGGGGFQGGIMGNMPNFGGFQPRGGFQGNMRGGNMGMRGGRGGMNANMMGMPMGGMPMGGAPGPMGGMGMGMPQMNAPPAMQAGYPNQGYYPPQNDANWNPHGAKRTRQE